MLLVRSFLNSDTHRLADAWREHWECVGIFSHTDHGQLEQAILDKPFFDYRDMIVVEENSQLAGFAQMQVDPSTPKPERARIASFCVGQSPDRRQIAETLVSHAIQMCRDQGITDCTAGTVLGDLSGLVGLEPYAGVIGILDADRLLAETLKAAGFTPQPSMQAFELALDTFRMPLDRELLMLRRTASVEERHGRLPKDWRAACAHSHFDISKFFVLNRADLEIASATYYLSDPDALVMDRGLVYLAAFGGREGSESEVDLANEIRFAVTSSIDQFARRGFNRVRAIIDTRSPSADARASFLKGIGFKDAASGAAYRLEL